MIQLGDIRAHLICESSYHIDPGGAYGLVPRALWSRYSAPDADHLVPMVSTVLLVQTGGLNVLVDAGRGDKTPAKAAAFLKLERPGGGLSGALARLGLAPADIHLVIDTHLHDDHCGGNTVFDAAGGIVPAFPNAEYVVQRREYEDASRPNERTRATYLAANFQMLVESGQMRLLDGGAELAPGVRGVVTPGHTPGHMSVMLESQGQRALFVSDLASFAVHFERLGWMTAYDVEPLVTLETKRRWQQWALDTGALLMFVHDPKRRAGRLTLDAEGRPALAVVDEPYT